MVDNTTISWKEVLLRSQGRYDLRARPGLEVCSQNWLEGGLLVLLHQDPTGLGVQEYEDPAC